MKTKTIEKIEQRLEELEEIATPGLYWEQIIYCDKKYEITLARYYDEQGFYLIIDKQGEKAELKELPKTVLEETLENLESCDLEEAIKETVHED